VPRSGPAAIVTPQPQIARWLAVANISQVEHMNTGAGWARRRRMRPPQWRQAWSIIVQLSDALLTMPERCTGPRRAAR